MHCNTKDATLAMCYQRDVSVQTGQARALAYMYLYLSLVIAICMYQTLGSMPHYPLTLNPHARAECGMLDASYDHAAR